jgi:hypothetical protein
MKGSASGYGVSGSGEYTKTDYQERRKDTAMTGGFILLAIVAVGAIVWFFWTEVKGTIESLTKGIGAGTGAIPDSTVRAANSLTPKAEDAINRQGEYYPVKTLTKEDYNNMLKSMGILEPVVKLGNIITPPAILDASAIAGAEAAATVNKLGLNNAYVDLPAYQKGLVTLGEGVGKLFGVDLIQAGYDMRAAIASSSQNEPMSDESRAFLGLE